MAHSLVFSHSHRSMKAERLDSFPQQHWDQTETCGPFLLKSWGNYSSEQNSQWPFGCGHSAVRTSEHETLGFWGLQLDGLIAAVHTRSCLEHGPLWEEEALVSTPNKNVLSDVQMPQSPSLRFPETHRWLSQLRSTSRALLPGQDILTPKMAHSQNFISLHWTPRMTTRWDLILWIRKNNFLIIIRASSYLGVLRLYRLITFTHHSNFVKSVVFCHMLRWGNVPGAVMGGPACDEVMKKIPGRQGRPGPIHDEVTRKKPNRQGRLG